MADYGQPGAIQAVNDIPKMYETQANDVLRNINLGPGAMDSGTFMGGDPFNNTTIGGRPEGQLVPVTDQFGNTIWITWEAYIARRAQEQAELTGDQGGDVLDQGVPGGDDISDTTIGENGGENEGPGSGPIGMNGDQSGGGEQVEGVSAADMAAFRAYKAAGGEVSDALGWVSRGRPQPRSAGERGGGTRTPFEKLFQMAEAAGGAIRFADGSINPKSVAQFEEILGTELTGNEIRLVQARLDRINRSLWGNQSLDSGGQMGGNQRNQTSGNQGGSNLGWGNRTWGGNQVLDQQVSPDYASANILGSSVERSPFTPFELTRSAEDMFKDYRLGSYPGATLRGLTGAGGRALTAGFNPAYGSFLLQSALNPEIGEDYRGDEGENIPTAFRQYLRRGMEGARPSLQDLRSGFGGLTNYLTDIGRPGAMQEDAAWAGHMPYMNVFGVDPNRSEILAAAGSALRGPRGFGSRTQPALGNMYDLFETRYGPGGMGKFGQFVQSAYGG